MTKRARQRWIAQVRRDLVKYVYGSVDACIPPDVDITEEDIRKYGNPMIRKFKAAIRKVR